MRKAEHLLAVLQGQAAYILHTVPAEATYEDIVEALSCRYEDHQLVAVFRAQLIVRIQPIG
jgi:N-acetyl-gamma-glutamylphosphate reductase